MGQSTVSSACAFVFIVLAIIVANSDADAPNQKSGDQGLSFNWFERKLKEKIESFREVLRKGEPAFGLPVLDPYRLDSKKIDVNTSIVLASTDIRNLTVVGFSSYSVDDVRVSLSNMSALVRLSWSGIKAMGDYNLDGVLNIPFADSAPLYGNGTARALFYKISIESKIMFTVEEDEIIKASGLELLWETVNPRVRVDGLFGGQELGDTINQIIEDIIPKLDAAYHDKVKKILEEKTLKLINDYLSGAKGEEETS